MKFFTKTILEKFALLGDQEDKPLREQTVVAKLFNPTGIGTWYLINYNEQTKTAFGFASIFGDHNDKFGTIYLPELEEYVGEYGIGIERDKSWTPTKVKNIPELSKHL